MNIAPFDTTDVDPSETDAGTQPWYHIDWVKVLAWLAEFGLRLLACVAIIVLAWLIARGMRLLVRYIVNRVVSNVKTKAKVDDTQALQHSPLADMRLVQRTRTLGAILQNIINTVVFIIVVLAIVHILVPELSTSFALLTAAVGAGLGFGAQNIVKDTLNGIFLVAEDQIGIGDVVDLGLATGIVENVSVRITEVRDVNGTLWFVRNGEITRIGNMSQGWSRAIVDVGASADLDLHEVEHVLLSTAQELAKDSRWRARVLDKPEVWGLERVDGDKMLVRVVVKTRTTAQEDVATELRERIRTAMHEAGLPLRTLDSTRLEGSALAQRTRGSNRPVRALWKAVTEETTHEAAPIHEATPAQAVDLPPGKVTGPIPADKPITKPIAHPPSQSKSRKPKRP